MTFAKYFKVWSYFLIGSGFAAIATTGVVDTLSIVAFTAIFFLSWHVNTTRLRQAISPWIFNTLALVYSCFIPVDYLFLSHTMMLAALHVLFFAAAIKLLTHTNDRDYLYLFFISLGELLLAATLTVNLAFIICFLVFVFSGLSILVLMEMLRSNAKMHRQANVLPFVAARKPQEIGLELFSPFPARLFTVVMLGIAILILFGAIPLFFLLPRISVGAHRQPSGKTQFVSGFAESIELGRVGQIKQSDAIVMRVKTDDPPEKLLPGLRWRGLAFDYFDGRAWRRSNPERHPIPTQGSFYKLENSAQGAALMRQTFFIEALSTDVVFAASRALAVSREVGTLEQDTADNLYTSLHTQNKTRYFVISDPIRPNPANMTDWRIVPPEIAATYLQLPQLDPRIKKLSESTAQTATGKYAQARALERYLRTHYAYSLTLQGDPNSKDPLAMFLFDVRAGHCEYFASALTIMLRQIGIPARMVNGFNAGDYNRMGNNWTVRKYHAHSWVEAYFPPYGWIEFDPTPTGPSSPRSSFAQLFSNLTDTVGLWWWEGVVNYDSSKQYHVVNRFLYGLEKVQDSIGALIDSVKRLGQKAAAALQSPIKIPELKKELFVSIPLIIILALLLFRPIRRRLLHRVRHFRVRNNSCAAAISFYAEALDLLEAHGVPRHKDQTPLEFAQSLGDHPAAAPFLSLTHIYYAARFGANDAACAPSEAQTVLSALRKALRSQKAGGEHG